MGTPANGLEKWLRRSAKLLLAALALAALVILAAILSLQIPRVRESILSRAATTIERSTGIHLMARDFALSLRTGEISVHDMELRAHGSESEPFLSIPMTVAHLGWKSLLSDRPQIYSLRLQEPEFDLGAPLPQGSSEDRRATRDLLPPLDIHRFELIDGAVSSGVAPDELDIWWDSWQADQMKLIGSLLAGIAELEIQETRLAVDSHRRPTISADLQARFMVDDEGSFAIRNLELDGDDLEVALEGRGRLESDAPFEATFKSRNNLAKLLPDLTTSGQLEASGDVSFTAAPEALLAGTVQVSGTDFPAELLDPLFAESVLDELRLEGTQVDLTADLEARLAFAELSTGPADDFVSGEVRATWRRQDDPLLLAFVHADPIDPAGDNQGIRASFEVEILPNADGWRTLAGALSLPGWTELDQIRLRDVQLRVQQDDLNSLVAELGLTPETLWGFRPAGGVTLMGTADGLVASPDLELEGSWRLSDRRLVEISANATAMSIMTFRTELLPDSPGTRTIQGGWRFAGLEGVRAGSFEDLKLEIDLPDIAESLTEAEEILEVLLPDPQLRRERLAALSPEITDRLKGSLQAHLTASGSPQAPALDLAAKWVPADSENLSLQASYDGHSLTLSDFSGTLDGLLPGDEVLSFASKGQATVENPLRSANLSLQILDPIEDIHQLDVNARLEGGSLTFEASSPSVPGSIEASVPLAILLDVLPDPTTLSKLPLVFDAGTLDVQISDLDLARASEIGFHLANFESADLRIGGVLDALVALDPANPLDAIGTLEIEALKVGLGEIRIESPSSLRADLEEGHIALPPTRLQVIGQGSEAPLDLTLSADLDSDWRPEMGFDSLVENFDLNLEGTVDSALSTPFLSGGVASGPVFLAASVQGSINDLEADLRLSGPDSSVVLPGRYRTRISELELEVGVDPPGAELRLGRMRLNRGEVELSGSIDKDENLQLAARLEDVRYRLDHGLTVVLDGNLDLAWPREGQRRLSGTIDVERGSLRRNVRLEQEVIRMFNPSDLAGAGSALEESIDLDLTLITREGVRVKNNLADLRADWDQIRVRGTLARPTLAGQIDVDSGGLITAYGQTVRIDQGALIFSGVPGELPRMDFETTSSAEDPRLRNQWNSSWSTGPDKSGPGGGFWDRYDPQGGSAGFQQDDFANSMTSYFQNRFLQSISGGAPRVELSVQPLPLMGETDTTARVTMSYHLTPQISYVLSQNPREAEGRTDILNLHNFAIAPSLQGQFFRNDQGNQGMTLQQVLEFGGGRRAEETMPRLGSFDLTAPKEVVRKRTVRRATGLRKGQSVDEGADFDIEIDMLDFLARRGYPAATVDVMVEPQPRNRVIVGITVEPGARVDFEFSGDQPRRNARRDIVALYQPTGMQESPALESVRRDTVRALRAQGFLDPQVDVTPEHSDPGNPTSDRIIRVHGEGGRQVLPRILTFPGLPDDVENTLIALFSSRLSRVELASAEPVADSLLIQSMQTMGYSEVQVLSRELSSDGASLSVEVEPGPRRHLAAVTIVGVDQELRHELDKIRLAGPGDPFRSDQISRTSLLMEDHLREQGFADAQVQARLEPVTDGDNGKVALFFDVHVGSEHRIGELRATGVASSRPGWVKRVSQLQTGELLKDSSLVQARRRLARTGVFQRIAIRREAPLDPEALSVLTPITFELEEHPRYRVTYGLRAESTREAGAVVDVSDLNFLGRGQTLGLRLIYATLERNARLYWSIPRIFQSSKTLELFVEARREELSSIVVTDEGASGGAGDIESHDGIDPSTEPVDNVVANIREAWAQITFPWGRRSVHRFYTVYKQSVTEFRSDPGSLDQRVVSPFSGWQVSYDTGERSFFETSTDKATVFLGSDLSFSSENLGSDYTGYGLFGQIKPQIPLVKMGDSALVWVHNYRVGAKEARDDKELPFFDRLFAGGEFSVRGYPTNSLGPLSDSGVPIGGEAMFVTNQELRFPLWTLLSGVAFFDAGNVWATLDDVESTLFKSIGVGLRADSPIGPLRLDFAYPLDRRESDPEYKVYFGLGQTF